LQRLRLPLFVTIGLAVLAYSGIVGFLAFSESSIVYASAGGSRSGRMVPADDAGIPWDTLRVADSTGVPVLLLESRLDTAAMRPWAIFLHGNAGFLGSRRNVQRYQLLRDAGFNVLAVEYRGYGAAAMTAEPSEEGVYSDAVAGWRHLTGTLGVRPNRIVVYGWSLGGGPAVYLAAKYPAAALITEGTFTSLPDVGAAMYPWVPVRYVMRNRFENLQRAASVSMPWIVFHARDDDEIPFTHGEALAAAAPRAQLVPLGSDHNDAVISDRDLSLATLREVARGISR
jgi:uncharacterized protein